MDRAHSQFELVEKKTHDRAMDHVKQATGEEQKSSQTKLKIAEHLVKGTDELRLKFIWVIWNFSNLARRCTKFRTT